MLEKFRKEKFGFEIFWLLLTGGIAFLKFIMEYRKVNADYDYYMIFYTAIIFVIPNLINARFCTNIFLMKYENKEFKNTDHKAAMNRGYLILNGLFWTSSFLNLILHALTYVFLESNKKYSLVFVFMGFNYALTFFIGMLSKFLTYFESKEGAI